MIARLGAPGLVPGDQATWKSLSDDSTLRCNLFWCCRHGLLRPNDCATNTSWALVLQQSTYASFQLDTIYPRHFLRHFLRAFHNFIHHGTRSDSPTDL